MNAPTRDPQRFIRDNTRVYEVPLAPEIRLHLASEVLPLWQMTEADLEKTGLPPPFWAFAWAGGQALARYILDEPSIVNGNRVLDFGAGSGIVGIAAAMAGARSVAASEIDPYAVAAVGLNAALNNVLLDVLEEDVVGQDKWDVVLAADVCYEGPAAARIFRWLADLAGRGRTVLVGDPGRTYLPKKGLEKLTSYAVMTSRELEDTDLRNTSVWRVSQG